MTIVVHQRLSGWNRRALRVYYSIYTTHNYHTRYNIGVPFTMTARVRCTISRVYQPARYDIIVLGVIPGQLGVLLRTLYYYVLRQTACSAQSSYGGCVQVWYTHYHNIIRDTLLLRVERRHNNAHGGNICMTSQAKWLRKWICFAESWCVSVINSHNIRTAAASALLQFDRFRHETAGATVRFPANRELKTWPRDFGRFLHYWADIAYSWVRGTSVRCD